MLPYYCSIKPKNAVPLWVVEKGRLANWLSRQPFRFTNWIEEIEFSGKVGSHVLLSDGKGKLAGALVVVERKPSIWSIAGLPKQLPKKNFFIDTNLEKDIATALTIGWGLGTYTFDRYRKVESNFATLVIPELADWHQVRRTVAATFFVRDLINMPSQDLGPEELEKSARAMAESVGGNIHVVKGVELARNFPAIHAVGRAGSQLPRLLDIRWGKKGSPKVTLVGKGVCFDSGGLNLKTPLGMRKMKKDMGGAATVLGLGHMIMDAGINLELRILIPTVENVIDSNAYRPGDIVTTRKGLTLEIDNTDAEGRVILADALTLASEDQPDLIIDLATLTGSARIALGTELPAVFTQDDDIYRELKGHCNEQEDPFWRLPLWENYNRFLQSSFADITNTGTSSLAGAITAALFLERFVDSARYWIHVDLYAWNDKNRPGRPLGGEATTMRGLFKFLEKRYGKREC